MQLLELIPPAPGLKVLEVTASLTPLSAAIAGHLEACEGIYHIELYPGGLEHGTVLPEWVRVHELPHLKSPFRGTAREFEVLILNDLLDKHQFPERILQLAYRTLENSGEIIVIQDKSSMPLETIKEKLEACEFRAVNDIELLEGFHVVTGKKMHMWGNGL